MMPVAEGCELSRPFNYITWNTAGQFVAGTEREGPASY